MSVAVKLSQLNLSYGGTPLFEGFNLELHAATWTCLLGRSGVGKSTLSRIVSGLEVSSPVQGERSNGEGGSLDGQVAWMAQQDLLLPWLTVLENVTLGARLRRTRQVDRRRALSLLERTGLSGTQDQLPSTLSGGMRQRVALARTLMEDRPVVVLDEPFAAVDALTRMELQRLAFELLTERTVLLITHDPLEALRLGHRVLVLRGSPATVTELSGLTSEPLRNLRDHSMSDRQAALLDLLT